MKVTLVHQGLLKEFVQILKAGMMHAVRLTPFYDLVNNLVWGLDGDIIRKLCCDSRNCAGLIDEVEEGVERMYPRTFFHSMIVNDPDATGPSFYLWVRIGIDPSFVFQAAPRFSDRVVSLI